MNRSKSQKSPNLSTRKAANEQIDRKTSTLTPSRGMPDLLADHVAEKLRKMSFKGSVFQ